MNRDLKSAFGSGPYAKEELPAEIFSAFMAAKVGLPMDDPKHFEQYAAYVNGWIKALKEDPHEIFRVAKDAEKMHEYILELERTHKRVKEGQENAVAPVEQAALAAPRRFVQDAQAALTGIWGPDAAVQTAKPDGQYIGQILFQTTEFAVQDIGRRSTAVHDKQQLSPEASVPLAKVPEQQQRIHYKALKSIQALLRVRIGTAYVMRVAILAKLPRSNARRRRFRLISFDTGNV